MSAIAFDQRDGKIWFDGKMVDWKDAKVHVLTHALHYGSGVFEGERAYNGKIFKLRDHTNRLIESAHTLDMEIPFTADEIDAACKQCLEVNNLKDAYVRPIAWRGSEMMGVSAQSNTIHLAIAVWDWPSYFPLEQRLKGLRLDIAKYKRPSPETIPCKAKATGLYMICTISKHEAERKGYADALMYDYRGYIAECTGANVFFIKNGEIHTPKPDCFLDGITRRTVIDLAKKRGVTVIERHIKAEEVGTFEQCFICGTAAEVTPVSEIGEFKFTVGPIIKDLMSDYDALVRA